MTDIVDSNLRSQLMAGIHGCDKVSELAVRRISHRMRLRIRLHQKCSAQSPRSDVPEASTGRADQTRKGYPGAGQHPAGRGYRTSSLNAGLESDLCAANTG